MNGETVALLVFRIAQHLKWIDRVVSPPLKKMIGSYHALGLMCLGVMIQ